LTLSPKELDIGEDEAPKNRVKLTYEKVKAIAKEYNISHFTAQIM